MGDGSCVTAPGGCMREANSMLSLPIQPVLPPSPPSHMALPADPRMLLSASPPFLPISPQVFATMSCISSSCSTLE